MSETDTKVSTKEAVTKALSILGKTSSTTSSGRTTGPALPSSRARAALERLARLGTIEALDATQPNLKAICKDLFDWHNNAGSAVNGNVVKTFGRALTAVDENGVSRYSQAVEMAGFASACAPLLQPDRLARLIALAPDTPVAYAPERYTLSLAGKLRQLLEPWPEQRRETLLTTFWQAAHDGRWWDMTSGLVTIKNLQGRDMAGEDAPLPVGGDLGDADLTAAVLGGLEMTINSSDSDFWQVLLNEELRYTADIAARVARLPLSDEIHDEVRALAVEMATGRPMDPDLVLLLAHHPALTPEQRPESPMTWLTHQLVKSLTDPESGTLDRKNLPDKPKAWRELYPPATIVGFPYPPELYRLDKVTLPGCAPGTATVDWIRNTAELAANRDYMGNCTWSYKSSLENGSRALMKVWRGTDVYNVGLLRQGTGWTVWEINSRHNRGGVPEDIRAGANAFAAALPATTMDEIKERKENAKVTFGVG